MLKKKGFSLVEVMILFTILSVVLAASLPMITKKSSITPRKIPHGVYRCIRDENGNLVEELYKGSQQVYSNSPANGKCTFAVPEAAMYKIDMYSAGSGGVEAAYIDAEPQSDLTPRYYGIGYNEGFTGNENQLYTPSDKHLQDLFKGKFTVDSVYTGDGQMGEGVHLKYDSVRGSSCGITEAEINEHNGEVSGDIEKNLETLRKYRDQGFFKTDEERVEFLKKFDQIGNQWTNSYYGGQTPGSVIKPRGWSISNNQIVNNGCSKTSPCYAHYLVQGLEAQMDYDDFFASLSTFNYLMYVGIEIQYLNGSDRQCMGTLITDPGICGENTIALRYLRSRMANKDDKKSAEYRKGRTDGNNVVHNEVIVLAAPPVVHVGGGLSDITTFFLTRKWWNSMYDQGKSGSLVLPGLFEIGDAVANKLSQKDVWLKNYGDLIEAMDWTEKKQNIPKLTEIVSLSAMNAASEVTLHIEAVNLNGVEIELEDGSLPHVPMLSASYRGEKAKAPASILGVNYLEPIYTVRFAFYMDAFFDDLNRLLLYNINNRIAELEAQLDKVITSKDLEDIEEYTGRYGQDAALTPNVKKQIKRYCTTAFGPIYQELGVNPDDRIVYGGKRYVGVYGHSEGFGRITRLIYKVGNNPVIKDKYLNYLQNIKLWNTQGTDNESGYSLRNVHQLNNYSMSPMYFKEAEYHVDGNNRYLKGRVTTKPTVDGTGITVDKLLDKDYEVKGDKLVEPISFAYDIEVDAYDPIGSRCPYNGYYSEREDLCISIVDDCHILRDEYDTHQCRDYFRQPNHDNDKPLTFEKDPDNPDKPDKPGHTLKPEVVKGYLEVDNIKGNSNPYLYRWIKVPDGSSNSNTVWNYIVAGGGKRRLVYLEAPILQDYDLESSPFLSSLGEIKPNDAKKIFENDPNNYSYTVVVEDRKDDGKGTDARRNSTNTSNNTPSYYTSDLIKETATSAAPITSLTDGKLGSESNAGPIHQEPRLEMTSNIWSKTYSLGSYGNIGKQLSSVETDLGANCTFDIAQKGKIYKPGIDDIDELNAMLSTSMRCVAADGTTVTFEKTVNGNGYNTEYISGEDNVENNVYVYNISDFNEAGGNLVHTVTHIGASKSTSWRPTSIWSKLFLNMRQNELYDIKSIHHVGEAGQGASLDDKCTVPRGIYKEKMEYLIDYYAATVEDRERTFSNEYKFEPEDNIQNLSTSVSGGAGEDSIVHTAITIDEHTYYKDGSINGINCYGVPQDENNDDVNAYTNGRTFVVNSDSELVKSGLMELKDASEGGGGAVVITW